MPFVWINEPQTPPQEDPLSYAGDATSSLVDVVANTVNAGGTLEYYTPATQYNVVYQVPQMNVNTTTLVNATIERLTINLSANVIHGSFNTANFGNVTANILNITFGTMGANPNSNLEIATKEYVDSLVSNVPAGGSDLQNLIDAPGDLLVGISANTATRLPIGSGVLVVDTSTTSGLRWRSSAIGRSELFNGLTLHTHFDRHKANSEVVLRQGVSLVMSDGSRTTGWSNVIGNINTTGAGGIDTGVKRNSNWYEIYAIRDSFTDNRALLFHQSTNITTEASATSTTDTSRSLRTTTSINSKLSQSFVSANSGPVTSVELELSMVGTIPTSLVWVELQLTDVGTGFPNGTILATSRYLDASRIASDKARLRFVFDSPYSISSNTSYSVVVNADYATSDTNFLRLWGTLANNYTSGYASEYHPDTNAWFKCSVFGSIDDCYFKIFVQNIQETTLIMPGSYDQYCLIGYVYVNSIGNLKHFMQKERSITTYVHGEWRAHTTVTGLIEAVDFTTTIPPRLGPAILSVYYPVGTPIVPTFVGGGIATNMPTTLTPGVGYTASNTRSGITLTPNEPTIELPPTIIENQFALIRTQNTGCRIYVTNFTF